MTAETFPMLCPTCGGKGCDQCKDGYREARFAKGNMYTRACTNPACRFENGGKIVDGKLEGSCGQCICCGQPAVWMLIGRV